MVHSIQRIRTHGRIVGIAAAVLLVVGLAVYFGLQYLERRDPDAQRLLNRGIEFYHAGLDAAAPEDPYSKGPEPVFKTEEARFQAANKEFGSVIQRFGASKLAVIARYYQGLCQLRLGQQSQAIKTLEVVKDNTQDRTVTYRAEKVLAKVYVDQGNPKAAQALIESALKDPQCELPKDELKLQLARAFEAQGKRDEALKTLREAQTDGGRSSLQAMIS